MARKLTMRQHKFAVEYVANGGNGTQAAKAAGYGEAGAHVLASNTLRNAKVQQVIAQAEARMIRRIEVTPDKIMADLEDYKELGVRTEQVGAAIRATELQGKQIGMFVDRSVNINVDLNGSHLDQLADLLSGPATTSSDEIDD
jgi:phage terminase small subunit